MINTGVKYCDTVRGYILWARFVHVADRSRGYRFEERSSRNVRRSRAQEGEKVLRGFTFGESGRGSWKVRKKEKNKLSRDRNES
jgi:hypothetical protein